MFCTRCKVCTTIPCALKKILGVINDTWTCIKFIVISGGRPHDVNPVCCIVDAFEKDLKGVFVAVPFYIHLVMIGFGLGWHDFVIFCHKPSVESWEWDVAQSQKSGLEEAFVEEFNGEEYTCSNMITNMVFFCLSICKELFHVNAFILFM